MRTSRPGRGVPRRVTRDSCGSSGEPVHTVPAASVMPKLPTWMVPGIAFCMAAAMPGGCTAKLLFISRTRERSARAKSA